MTERESWILDNLAGEPEADGRRRTPRLIEPGIEFAAKEFGEGVVIAEVHHVVATILEFARRWRKWKQKILVNDRIADSIFQQIIIRPSRLQRARDDEPERRLHLGRRRRAGGWAWHRSGRRTSAMAMRCFEATHGTAPKYADLDVINPGSVMLSGVMLFDFLGWHEAARMIESSLETTIGQKYVTYDFERQMQGATKAKTSEFASRMIENMGSAIRA